MFPPTISGSARQGQTLTESHGLWTNGPTGYSYQWEDCNASGQACAAIAGATGPLYVLTGADVGDTIVVQETASNSGGAGTPARSALTNVVLPLAPTDVTPPTIAGATAEGDTLTESHGTWTNTPTSYHYAWYDCNSGGTGCTSISGATNQNYSLGAADLGDTIRVSESASNAGGSSTVLSAATAVVTSLKPPSSPPVKTSAPTVKGFPVLGQRLVGSTGRWKSSTPPTYAFQWQRCSHSCTNIAGATASSYKVRTSDLGARVRVVVTATNGAGSQRAVSAPAGPVTRPVSRAESRAMLSAALGLHGTLAKIGEILRHDGYAFVLRAPGAGTLKLAWHFEAGGGRAVVIARTTITFRSAGRFTIRLSLTPSGRSMLMRVTHLTVRASGTFAAVGAHQVGSSRNVALGG